MTINKTADEKENFCTYDLGCASALLSKGVELVALDKSNPKKAQFIFRKQNGIDFIVDNYWTDKLDVKARSFFDNIKALKNRIYSE